MEKEVTPNKIPIPPKPKTPTTKTQSPPKTSKNIPSPPKPIPSQPTKNLTTSQPHNPNKKVSYRYAGKEKLSDLIKKSIPEQLIPTKRMGEIFGYVFLAVLIIAALIFPYGDLIQGKTDMALKIGVPFTFLELSATDPQKLPIKPFRLAADMIIYLILAYAIEVIINMSVKIPFLKSKEEKKKYPKLFKDKREPTLADQITKKIILKNQPPLTKPQPQKQTLNQQKTTQSKKTTQIYNIPQKPNNQKPNT